jgi:hypothetical protein
MPRSCQEPPSGGKAILDDKPEMAWARKTRLAMTQLPSVIPLFRRFPCGIRTQTAYQEVLAAAEMAGEYFS